MSDPQPSRRSDIPVIHLLPNLLTIIAICAGMTAIRFGYQGDFPMAVKLILLAAVLDGLDGRLARLIRSQSPVGAELDSLADFLNFGVAPALLLHAWALQDFSRAGWVAVLGYAVCCVLRLARFNVNSRLDVDKIDNRFFVGVPSPAGAVLVLLPMTLAFALPDLPRVPPAALSVYMLLIGALMISHLPTWSFKNLSVSRSQSRYLLLITVLVAALLFTYLWAILVVATFLYGAGLIWSIWTLFRPRKG